MRGKKMNRKIDRKVFKRDVNRTSKRNVRLHRGGPRL